MLYKNITVKVHPPDGDTSFFIIVAGILKGDILAPYLFLICQDYALQMSIDLIKEYGFTLKKARSPQYPTETITDTDYIALLTNTPTQEKSLIHSLEQTAEGIGLLVNADKTEYMFLIKKKTSLL